MYAMISQVAERLALSFKNSRGLNQIINKRLPPARPHFQREELVVAGEPQEVFFRDILQCITALWGDPNFAPILLLVPERHYADPDHTDCVYFDMNTGKWWWATQVRESTLRHRQYLIHPHCRRHWSARGLAQLLSPSSSCLIRHS